MRRHLIPRFPSAMAWLVSFAVCGCVGWLSFWKPLRALENLTCDWRTQIRGVRPLPVPITIIALDQKTLDAPGAEPLIFWGEKHARVLQILRDSGAKAIGFDLLQPLSLPNDLKFGSRQSNPDQLQAQQIAMTPQLVLSLSRNLLPSGKVSETLPNETFRTALALGGGGLGFVNTTPDEDGNVRAFAPMDSDGTPSFPLEIARIATGKEPKLHNGNLIFGAGEMKLDANGKCLINYVGPDTTFPRISYQDLLSRPAAYRDQIKDRICLIGTTSYELQDYHYVPFPSGGGRAGQLMAGVEINANMVSTLLSGTLWRAGATETWVCLALVTALSVPCCCYLRIPLVVPGLLALAAGWTALCMMVFVQKGWLLPLTPILIALAANGLLLVVARLRDESAHKKRVESVFGRYVSPVVLEHLMNTPGATDLGGRRQTITVLFSDIRGFTSRSEQMEPEQVTQFLNLYLEKMVDVVFAHGGTIDKYMGDGIMAIWNWPYEQADHSLRATRAALQMQQEVEEAAAEWQKMGFPVLRIGIGIHCGIAVLGNIGAPQRMEQTAIGDTVNVASRLESLTKETSQTLGSSILVSGAVRDAIEKSPSDVSALGFTFVPAGKTTIRGRKDEIELYAIIPQKSG